MANRVYISLSDPWTPEEFMIIRRIVRSDGYLSDHKPDISDDVGRMAAYVWRCLQFVVSGKQRLQCMPVLCFYELPGETLEEQEKLAKYGDYVVDKILEKIPPHKWLGVKRWANIP